jgi:hypothetical protein
MDIMPELRFTDGVSFNTDGPLRVEVRHDGYYVVGGGTLMAVESKEDGEAFIRWRVGE